MADVGLPHAGVRRRCKSARQSRDGPEVSQFEAGNRHTFGLPALGQTTGGGSHAPTSTSTAADAQDPQNGVGAAIKAGA